MEAYWHYLKLLADDKQIKALKTLGGDESVFGTSEKHCFHSNTICIPGDILSSEQITKIQPFVDYRDIEYIFDLVHPYDLKWLKQSIIGMLEADQSLSQFYSQSEHEAIIHDACAKISEFPPLLFRLSVLGRVRPAILDRSFFCALFGMFVSVDAKREPEFVLNLIIASLTHDLGLLDITESLLKERRDDLGGHSLEYYRHTSMGADFLRGAGVDNDIICEAICQHHETIDGTGFPNGLVGIHLNEIGQIINMFDSLFVVYSEKFKPLNRGITDLVPIIEMNSVTRFGHSAKQLITLLKTGKRSENAHVFNENDPAAVNEHVQKVEQLINVTLLLFVEVDRSNALIQEFTNKVGFRHDDKALSALQNGFFHIALTIHKSEKINIDYIRKIENLTKLEKIKSCREIEDLMLMLKEVMFHIYEFKKHLNNYFVSCKNPKVKDAAGETLEQLERSLKGVSNV